jgi:iron complex outermembrane recepter protein
MTTLRARNALGSRSSGMRRALLCGAALSGFAAMPSTAFAQDAETAEEIPEDRVIIVQARKQSESLQEVPVTVTAIGSEALERYNVDQVADVVSRVPTLNVQVGGSGSGGTISLRGVGSSAISSAFDSAVAFDLDGIQVSTLRLVQAGFFDTAQIDVLKGPQSLFFGKSASAGVFAIRSADPTSRWSAGGKAGYEFEEQGYLVNGFVSGPITDTLGIRLAAQYTDATKYIRLQPGTPAVNQNRGLRDFVGRLTLDWQPQERFRANFKLQYTKNENDGAIGIGDINCGANGRADEIVLFQGAVAIPAGYDCNLTDERQFLPDAAPPLVGSIPSPSEARGRNGVPFGETDILFGRLKFDLDFSEALTLSSVSGFLDLDAVDFDCYSYGGVGPAFTAPALGGAAVGTIAPALAAINGPGVPLGVGCSDPRNQLQLFSQEIRLTTDFDGPLNFMLGAFYESRQIVFDTAEQAVNISLIAPDPITGFTTDYDRRHETTTDAYSVFGNVIFDITDELELSGGIRYTKEDKVNTISVPFVHSFLGPGPAFVGSGFFSGPIEFSDDNFSPEVSLRYQATPDINLYASYKTGFKSGGIDTSALPSNSLSVAALSGDFSGLIFDSETGKGGEVGVKSQFAGRSLTLNASVFYYVFDDLQVQNFNATTIQFVTSNAGQLTTKGVDINWGWDTPVDGLSLSGTLAYTDAKYTAAFVQPGADGILGGAGSADDIDLDGRRASQAPEWAGNIAVDWTIPINDSFQVGLNGNVAYNDGYFTDESTFTDFFQDSFVTFDGSISIGHPDDKWKLSLVGVNLTNEIVVTTSGGRPFLAAPGPAGLGLPAGDDFVVNQNRGRQVFAEVSFKF